MLSRMFFSLWWSVMFKSGRRIVFICLICFNLFFSICFFFYFSTSAKSFCSIPFKKQKNLYLDYLFFNAKYAGSRWVCTRNPSLCVLDEKLMLDGDFYSAFFFSISGVPANWCFILLSQPFQSIKCPRKRCLSESFHGPRWLLQIVFPRPRTESFFVWVIGHFYEHVSLSFCCFFLTHPQVGLTNMIGW